MNIEFKNHLRVLVRQAFPKKRVLRIIKLRKEASNRDYYRIFLSGQKTCVAMILNHFEKDPGILSRIKDSSDIFNAYKIETPSVYKSFPKEKVVLVRDARSLSLKGYCKKFGIKRCVEVYKNILNLILKIHHSPIPEAAKTKKLWKAHFTETKFKEEFLFFFLHSGLQAHLSEASKIAFLQIFDDVSKLLCREKFVFTHRDLHSQNIFIKDEDANTSIWLDHQDARQGPWLYDFVSLVKDSYVELPQQVEMQLIMHYLDDSKRLWGKTIDEKLFFESYYLTLLQRSLKAAGTFFYQCREKKNLKYRPYIPIVLKDAILALSKQKIPNSFFKLLETELTRLIRDFS
jgi:aminoglycoside/choline kinase family phosphotransferase